MLAAAADVVDAAVGAAAAVEAVDLAAPNFVSTLEQAERVRDESHVMELNCTRDLGCCCSCILNYSHAGCCPCRQRLLA